MANSQRYEIEIATKASGNGAQETKEELQNVAEAAARVGEELGDGTALPVEKTKELADAMARTASEAAQTQEALRGAAEEAQRAVNIFDTNAPKIGPRLEDGSFFPAPEQLKAANEFSKEYSREMDRAAAAIMAGATAEKEAASIQQQRRILAYQLLEATEATAQGDREGAEWMMREVQIRREAIALQVQAKMTEGEALELATKRVTAEREALAAKRAANNESSGFANALSRSEPNWRGVVTSATTISGQLATGTTSLQSWTRLLGQIRPAFGFATGGIALTLKLAQAAIKASKEANLETLKSGRELETLGKSFEAARSESADEIGHRMEAARQNIAALTEEIRKESIESSGIFEREGKKLAELKKSVVELLLGKSSELDNSPAGQLERQERYLKSLERVAAMRQAEEAASRASAEAAAAASERFQKRLEESNRRYEQSLSASEKLTERFNKLQLEQLSKPERLESLRSEVEKITEELRTLGIVAETPAQAFEKARNLWPEQAVRIQELAISWAELGGKIEGTEEELATAARNRAKEIAELQEQIEELQQRIPRLKADLEDMRSAGNDFVEARWKTLGGVENSGWFRRGDTVQNGSGAIVPVDPSKQVAANNADLTRYQQLERELQTTTQKLAQDQAALGDSARDTARVATQVAQSTEKTAQAAQQFGQSLDRGMNNVHTVIARLPEQVNGQTNQMIQAINALSASMQNQSQAVEAAVSNLTQRLNQITTRIQGLERAAYR